MSQSVTYKYSVGEETQKGGAGLIPSPTQRVPTSFDETKWEEKKAR